MTIHWKHWWIKWAHAKFSTDFWRDHYCEGVKNADENELKAIASPPQDTHVYNVADFSDMSSIVEGLTRIICDRVEQLNKDLKGKA